MGLVLNELGTQRTLESRFFYFHLTWIGLILLVALLAVILREFYFARKQNPVHQYLLMPYVLWLLVAFSLNLYISLMN